MQCQKYRINFNKNGTYYSESFGVSNRNSEEKGESPRQLCATRQAACLHKEQARLPARPYEHNRMRYKEARTIDVIKAIQKIINNYLIMAISTRGVPAVIMTIKLIKSSRTPEQFRPF